MLSKKQVWLLFILFISTPILAQVDTAWVRRYNGVGNAEDRVRFLVVDDRGNVYVTGRSTGTGISFDYATIKYNSGGDTLWVRRYNGTGNNLDDPNVLAVDTNGYVYLTGRSYGGGTFYDYATIKYTPNGDTLWVRRFNGPGNALDQPYALALDRNGNVYVTGESWTGSSSDYATIKYTPNGEIGWVRYYDGLGQGEDRAYALAVDDSGYVYVTGESIGKNSSYDYATIKYDSSGNITWVRRYNGVANGDDAAYALRVGPDGNLYVTGMSLGNGTYFDYLTIKYSKAGDTLWVRRYNGTGNYGDRPYFLMVDKDDNVYLTGNSYGSASLDDYATIKYNSQGQVLWIRRYNGPQNNTDLAFSLAVDDSGKVYVTGCSDCYTKGCDYTTICYSSPGDSIWVKRYNGTADSTDIASAIALDKNGKLYLAGTSIGSGSSYDYVTIKYNLQPHLCLAKAGDVNGDNSISLSDVVSLVNHLFKGESAPSPFCRGDVNADDKILLSDVIYLVNYIFKSGPAPVKSGECCL